MLIGKLARSAEFRNISWMVADRLWRMVTSLVVSVWVIRYLGPDNFGQLNYVFAYTAIATVIASFGMESFLVKELVSEPQRKIEAVYSAMILRLSLAVIVSLLLLAVLYAASEPRQVYLILLLLVPQVFTNAFGVVDVYFQAELKSRVPVIARNSFFLVNAFLKVAAIQTGQGIYVFAVLTVLDMVLADLFLFFYFLRKHPLRLRKEVRLDTIWHLSRNALPFLLTNITIVLYMKIDQVLLGKLVDKTEVGYFTAATKVAEVFYFIPLVITGSLYGLLINSRARSLEQYNRNRRLTFFPLVVGAAFMAVLVYYFSPVLVSLLFGKAYLASIPVLQVYIWSIIFVFAGVAFNQILVIENQQQIILYKTVIGVVLNLALNLALIPVYGAMGAALATLATQMVASVGANFIFKNSRKIFLSYFVGRT